MKEIKLPQLLKLKWQSPLVSFLFSLFLFSLISSLYQTKQAIDLILEKDLPTATKVSAKANIFPKIVSTITFHKINIIEAWNKSLSLVPKINELEKHTSFVAKNIFSSDQPDASLLVLETDLKSINDDLLEIQSYIHSSNLLKNIATKKKIDKVIKLSTQLIASLETINKKPHTFLVLLQNSEELRASGGFMGSYARVDLNNGKVTNITIQDIYEPDGQFTGFVDAPQGAKQYLSGGEGLRLPDSNWHPDFPTAAKTISSYFAFGDERRVDSIIALNVDQIEKMLKIIGAVYLPDYGLTVTADNLTALARVDRNAFFAGSKQKANFLTALFNNLKVKASDLTPTQQIELAQVLLVGLEHKDIQLFSWHPQLQEIFTDYDIAGEIEYREQADFYLYLPESNVGINKANKKITREITIDLGQDRSELEILFKNDDTHSLLDYVNYQRVLVDPMVNIKEIKYGDQPVDYYQEVISNSLGNKFRQIGFLLLLESGTSQTLKISLSHRTICVEEKCNIQLQKQSGLQPTPYQINYRGQSKNVILEKDTIINF